MRVVCVVNQYKHSGFTFNTCNSFLSKGGELKILFTRLSVLVSSVVWTQLRNCERPTMKTVLKRQRLVTFHDGDNSSISSGSPRPERGRGAGSSRIYHNSKRRTFNDRKQLIWRSRSSYMCQWRNDYQESYKN